MATEPERIVGRPLLLQVLLPWPLLVGCGAMAVLGLFRHLWFYRDELAAGGTPRVLALGMAGFIAVVAITLLATGWPGLRWYLERHRLEEDRPQEPWLWSARPWDSEKSVAPGGVFRYARYPFRLGGAVEGTLALSGPLASAPRLRLTLLCLHERTEGKNRRVMYGRHEDVLVVDAPPGLIRIPLPKKPDLSTSFRYGQEDLYWVLDVEAEPPGADRATFLLPVYA